MKRAFFFSIVAIASLGGIFGYQSFVLQDHKLHIVFCDVGQGDAIYIKTPSNSDILIDGGPNESVLSCLGSNMPFWDKTLELVILTHPHADHLNGLISVAENYKIIAFATEDLKNKTQGFAKLMDLIKNQERIKIQYVYAGDKFELKDEVVLEVVGPTKKFLQLTSPGGNIGESGEFASVLSLIKYKGFEVLLTGDSQASELSEAIQSFDFAQDFSTVSVLQVPHHGSKTGLNSDILDSIKPELAVISVGSNNKYGHPAKEIIEILRDRDIKILRTDRDGEIEIVSDGVRWGVGD
ncbi:MAG: MBL fold metallo-hydrolase [Patescibacteria group bacterium]